MQIILFGICRCRWVFVTSKGLLFSRYPAIEKHGAYFMALDPDKKRIVLVVHGVQMGDDSDLNQDESIRRLLNERIGRDDNIDYGVELFKYEDLNDDVTNKYKQLLSLLISNPVGKAVSKAVIDLAGDVVISLANDSTADKIRSNLYDKIMSYYDSGHPCYVVAHSLGSVYSFDVINGLMRRNDLFERNDRSTWPVFGWLTMGSPLGLGMFKGTGRGRVSDLGLGNNVFPWRNYFDITDPVVSGEIFGTQLNDETIAEDYLDNSDTQGWYAKDYRVDTGKVWLAAHTAYWKLPQVGDGLRDMLIR